VLFFSDLDKLLGRGEAAHAEGQQDPAACVAALGGALGQLLADLTVDLIPDVKKVPNTANHTQHKTESLNAVKPSTTSEDKDTLTNG